MRIYKSKPLLGAVTTVLLTACGATYLPSLWNTPFELLIGIHGYLGAKPTVRELIDGSLRLAYQRDETMLVVDTYSPSGDLLNRAEVSQPSSSADSCYHKPLFLTDDAIYWIGCNYADSVKWDLASNSVISLPMPDSTPIAADAYFGVNDAALLENGQLVLVGGDYEPDQYYQTRSARILIVEPDGSVSSRIDELDITGDTDEPYATVVPVQGTNQFLVQHLERYSGNTNTQYTEQGDGLALTPRADLHDRKLAFADTKGVWTWQINKGISHIDSTGEFTWQLPNIYVEDINPTSDGQYLVLNFDAGKYKLIKINPEGVVQWSTDVTPSKGYKSVYVTENGGRILVTQGNYYTDPAFIVDDTQEPPVTILTGNKYGKVQHLLLGLDGNEIARFAEPKYDAVLLRDTQHPDSFNGVREFTEGSCLALGGMVLRNGDFVSLSDWCSDQPNTDASARLFYFNQP